MADRFRDTADLVEAVAAAEFDRPPAVVANAHVTGLGVARALSAADVPVIAVDRSPDGVAPYSDAVELAGRVTYPLDDLEGYRADVEAIADACDHEPVAVGCMDEWVHALVDARPEGVRLPFAADRVDRVLDKERLYAAAGRLDVPFPETYRIEETTTAESDDGLPALSADEAADRLGLPLVVKPALKRRFEEAFGTNVVEVRDRERYAEVVASAREAGIRLLAQARVEKRVGADRSLASYVPADGATDDALGVVGNAAVRYPRGYGTSCVVHETADDAAATVRERALSVLDDAGYGGVSEAEFVYDADRDTHVLLDVNTRPWKWIALPVAAGRNLPLAAYADATDMDREVASATPPDDPVTWVYLRDYIALLTGAGDDGNAAVTRADRQALSPAHWRALVAGEVSEHRDLTTGVYRPADPEPAYRLIESEITDREYYCAC